MKNSFRLRLGIDVTGRRNEIRVAMLRFSLTLENEKLIMVLNCKKIDVRAERKRDEITFVLLEEIITYESNSAWILSVDVCAPLWFHRVSNEGHRA